VLDALEHRDPQLVESYTALRERIMKDGAIPAKYKLLMAMITDAIAAHRMVLLRSPPTPAPRALRRPRSPRRSRSDTCSATPQPW
jgi:hypothetical protein